MLSGKTKQIFNILKSNSNDWVSVRKIVTSVWGSESLDTDIDEKKWRRNLSGHLSKIKADLNSDYRINKSRDLDAVQLSEDFVILKGSVPCVSCGNRFMFEAAEYSIHITKHVYCLSCLCSMMEELGA